MVTLFKRPGAEEGLDARIAGLRRGRAESDIAAEKAALPPPPENAAAPAAVPAAPSAPVIPAVPAAAPPPAATSPPSSVQEHLTVAREELVARLSAEIRPERRALLSRKEGVTRLRGNWYRCA